MGREERPPAAVYGAGLKFYDWNPTKIARRVPRLLSPHCGRGAQKTANQRVTPLLLLRDNPPPVSRRVFSCPRLSVRSQTMHTLFQRIYKKNITFFVGFVNQFFKPFTHRTSFHAFAPRCGQ